MNNKQFIFFLIISLSNSLNYTTIQERVIGSRPDLVRVFGRVQDGVDVDTWSYPSSSTQTLKKLYRAEQELLGRLHSLVKEIENPR